MSQEICTFKYCKTTNGFEASDFDGSELVFIEQTGQIWTHGKYFGADLTKIITKDYLNNLLNSYVTEDVLTQYVTTDQLINYQPKGNYVVIDDLSNYYNKQAVDNLLSNYYNKQVVDNKLSNKAGLKHSHTTSDITGLSTYINSLVKKIEIVEKIPDKPNTSTIYLVV